MSPTIRPRRRWSALGSEPRNTNGRSAARRVGRGQRAGPGLVVAERDDDRVDTVRGEDRLSVVRRGDDPIRPLGRVERLVKVDQPLALDRGNRPDVGEPPQSRSAGERPQGPPGHVEPGPPEGGGARPRAGPLVPGRGSGSPNQAIRRADFVFFQEGPVTAGVAHHEDVVDVGLGGRVLEPDRASTLLGEHGRRRRPRGAPRARRGPSRPCRPVPDGRPPCGVGPRVFEASAASIAKTGLRSWWTGRSASIAPLRDDRPPRRLDATTGPTKEGPSAWRRGAATSSPGRRRRRGPGR